MMRAPKAFAVVVRRRDGSLHVREREVPAHGEGIARWPFARGLASLVESLRLGSEALRFSVEQLESDMDGGAAGSGRGLRGTVSALGVALVVIATRDGEAGPPAPPSTASAGARSRYAMLALVVLFFVALPQGAAAVINRIFHLGYAVQSPAFQAMTGLLKLSIVIGYLLAIRRVPEIRRVFQYHGAEHKTISTYEAGEPLTVENARPKTTFHPRCGTTFLVMVALVSIVIFTAVGALLPRIRTGSVVLDNAVFFAEKLPFLPALVALAFELQRLFARYCTRGPLRLLLWPGFWVQKITTAEPDDAQLEVALASLRATLFRPGNGGLSPGPTEARFSSYAALVAGEASTSLP
jgi:uncharacterized protein YqhQ